MLAQQHGMTVRGHNLVWHSQLPGWVSSLPSSQVRAAMENHITNEAGHYKGKVVAWDVTRCVGITVWDYTDKYSWVPGAWGFLGGQTLTSTWSGTFAQSGSQVTVTNLDWNRTIAPGASTSVGFTAAYSGSNPAPTSFTINGAGCS
jgi:cellulase/cellobiase CelA1